MHERLCQLCSGITAEALVSETGYVHAEIPANLGRDCDLCERLGLDYVRDYDPASGDDPDGNSGFSKWGLRLSVNFKAPRVCNLKLTSEIWPGPEREWTQDEGSYYLVTPIGDPAAKHGIPAINRTLTSTGSTETFAFIRSCLEECDRSHDCSSPFDLSRPLKNSPRALPARLVCVSGSNDSIRLVPITKSCPPYMTLSHRWGAMPDSCLTKTANLKPRQRSFSTSVLPASFRDAVDITRKLSVDYLWIDTLCIIQDSPEDWATESVKMGSIYQNSSLNIAASHAQNSSSGCFNQQSISRDRASKNRIDTIEIVGEDSNGAPTTLIFYKTPLGDIPDLVKQSPLHQRGWTFQERVLPSRTVHFTSSQVLWECRKGYWFEDGIPWSPTGTQDQPVSSVLRPDLTNYTTSTMPQFVGDMRAAGITDHWYSNIVAGNYSPRKMTQPADRLIALAGIAEVYQNLTKDKYIAGLWQSSLTTGLSWVRRGWPIDGKPTKGHRWPTWSWAARDDPLRFDAVHLHPRKVVADPDFSLVDVQLEYAQGHVNEYSPVSGGHITVTGCLVELVCKRGSPPYPEHGSCSYPVHWQNGWKGVCFIDEPSKDRQPRRLNALVVGRKNVLDEEGDCFLLLEPYNKNAYIRVGYARVDYRACFRNGQWKDTRAEGEEVRAKRRPQTIRLY